MIIIHKMAVMFVTAWICVIFLAFSATDGSGEFIVTHSPSHVTFRNDDSSLKISEIQDVISSSFGYEIKRDLSWSGLGQGSLFQRPKANVVFSVEGAPQSDLKISNVAKYSTEMDVPELDTESVVNNIQSSADNEKPLVVDFSVDTTMFDIRSHQPELFHKIPTTFEKLRQVLTLGQTSLTPVDMASLNTTNDSDAYFLGEVYLVREIVAALKNNQHAAGNLPNFFHFKIRGLKGLVQEHGENSVQVKDAIVLLEALLDQMTEEFRDLYDDNVVVEVVILPKEQQILSRKSRQLLQDESTAAPPGPPSINIAENYTEMYPIVFNIILWTMVVMTLAVIGISYGIWFMDPGRDSIIYRMTSQRIKKD